MVLRKELRCAAGGQAGFLSGETRAGSRHALHRPGQNNPDPSEGPWGRWSIPPHGGASIYGLVEKKHRVAVTRVIRQMDLPLSWKWNGGCLYNANSPESTKLHFMLEGCHNLELIERALVTIYGWSPLMRPRPRRVE
jgi:hypothetical protein